jgi:hypothetical protein
MTKPNKKNTAKVKTVEIPEAELANLVQSVGHSFDDAPEPHRLLQGRKRA